MVNKVRLTGKEILAAEKASREKNAVMNAALRSGGPRSITVVDKGRAQQTAAGRLMNDFIHNALHEGEVVAPIPDSPNLGLIKSIGKMDDDDLADALRGATPAIASYLRSEIDSRRGR